jgi:hypothetical protein
LAGDGPETETFSPQCDKGYSAVAGQGRKVAGNAQTFIKALATSHLLTYLSGGGDIVTLMPTEFINDHLYGF